MNRNKAWTVALIAAISAARIGMGIYSALNGPTLLYMADNVGVSVTAISTVFTARSVGILLGGIIAGMIKRMAGPTFRHLLTMAVGVGVLGLSALVIPWISQFWLLVCVIIVGGIMYGYLDAGLQALVLQLWGEKASRPQIQLLHFMFLIGALLTPLFAAPFLTKANSVNSAKDQCPGFDQETEEGMAMETSTVSQNYTTINDNTDKTDFNPIGWVFIIAASFMVVVSCAMVLLSLFHVEKRVSKTMEDSGTPSEIRTDEPLRDVIWLLISVVAFYSFCVTVANVYNNFLYSVALCSDFEFTPAQASTMTSIFFAAGCLSRLSGTAASKYFNPRTIILFGIGGSIADMVLMCIWGDGTQWIAWTVTALHGYTTSLLYPAGVSWVAQYTSVSGTYMFVFNIGNVCGSLPMLQLAGYIFDKNPFSIMYLVLALAIGQAVFFVIALFVAKSHRQFLERKCSLEEDEKVSKVEDYAFENGGFHQTKF